MNGIFDAQKHVVPDIPKDEFVSAYQEAVTYTCARIAKAPL